MCSLMKTRHNSKGLNLMSNEVLLTKTHFAWPTFFSRNSEMVCRTSGLSLIVVFFRSS